MEKRVFVFMFNGPPNSGKDFIANSVAENIYTLGFKAEVLSASAILDKEVAEAFGVDLEEFVALAYNRDPKSVSLDMLGGRSPREAKIYFSEQVQKVRHGSDYYGKKTATVVLNIVDASENNPVIVFVTGVGFDDEVEAMSSVFESRFGKGVVTSVVRIYRSGCSFENDSRQYVYRVTANNPARKDMSVTNDGTYMGIEEAQRKILEVILG